MPTVTGIIIAAFVNLCTLLQNLVALRGVFPVALLVTLQGFDGDEDPDYMAVAIVLGVPKCRHLTTCADITEHAWLATVSAPVIV